MIASSGRGKAWPGVGVCALLGLALATRVQAEDAPVAGYVVYPAEAEARPTTAQIVAKLARDARIELRPLATADVEDAEHSGERRELAVLRDVERALLEARELNAELREAAALRVLASAEQALLGVLTLPGVHTFLAEVYLQLALCAAQLDQDGLFESALARALSLDPERRIEAAEAPPAIVKHARELAQRRDLAPLSEGRIAVQPDSASAWLDGVHLPAGELTFRARAGLHLLVVRAAGHAPYATLLQLEQGKRPDLIIALSPRPTERARRALLEAGAASERGERAQALSAATGAPVYVLELGRGPLARALVQRCSPAACGSLEGHSTTAAQPLRFADAGRAHAWLDATPHGSPRAPTAYPEKPIWKRWPLWTGAAALLIAGAVTAVLVTRTPEPRHELTLEIDASALPR